MISKRGGTCASHREVAESDFTRLLAESEADEKSAQASYLGVFIEYELRKRY